MEVASARATGVEVVGLFACAAWYCSCLFGIFSLFQASSEPHHPHPRSSKKHNSGELCAAQACDFLCSMSAKKHTSLPTCLCGCEGTTTGGRYLPGHDARHKSALVQAAIAGGKRAENKLFALGWAGFLDAARQKQQRQEGKKPKAKKAEAPEVAQTTEP